MKKILVFCFFVMVFWGAGAQNLHKDTMPPLNAAIQLSLAYNGSFIDVHGYNLANLSPSFMYWRVPNAINLVNIENISFSRDTIPLDTVARQQGKSNIFYKTNVRVGWEQDYHYFIPKHDNIALYFGNAFYVTYGREKYIYNPTTGGPWSYTYVKMTFGMNFGLRYFFNSHYYLDLSFPVRDIAGGEVDFINDVANNYQSGTFKTIFFNINDYSARFGLGVRILTKGK